MNHDLQKEARHKVPVEVIKLNLPLSFASRYGKRQKRLQFNANVLELAEQDFSKKFIFRKKLKGFKLPKTTSLYQDETWEIPALKELKFKLNEVKSKLSGYSLKDWHNHTRNTNHAGNVIPLLRRRVRPEFLTQAWCKLYEMLCSFPVIPKECERHEKFNSLHLCEAPGAFVTSLNHYLKLNHPTAKWDWLGTTLSPYHEGNHLSQMINDDRFIFHTLDHWCFGKDSTGNLLNVENFTYLLEKARKMEPILLVTADGSIDCQNTPGEQELIVSHLHYIEAIAALYTLAQGGSFIMKVFTIFECETVCLLYFLYSVFESVSVFKPITSKEGNSEIYLICTNYIGRDGIVDYLEEIFNHSFDALGSTKILFSKSCIPEHFLHEVEECAAYFTNLQMAVLERNIFLYEHRNVDCVDTLLSLKKCIAENFLERFGLTEDQPVQYIVGNEFLWGSLNYNLQKRDEDGPFQERHQCLEKSEKEYLMYLKNCLERLTVEWDFEENIHWLQLRTLKLPSAEILRNLSFGTPVKELNSSKFCIGNLISIRKQLDEHIKPCEQLPFETDSSQIKDLLTLLNENPAVICDVHAYSWYKNVCVAQKIALSSILEGIKKLDLGLSFVIVGLPLLTQFNVSMVFLLGHMFESVGIFNPLQVGYGLIFQNLKNFDYIDSLIKISEILEVQSIISIFPITYLCQSEDWYRAITNTNHCHLKKVCSELIQYAVSTDSPK